MNAQEIFDTVVNHLRKQGKKAIGRVQGTCQYLTEDGCKCAAGCLLLEGEYDRDMENMSFAGVLELSHSGRYKHSINDRLGEHRGLICKLQRIHDKIDVEEWEEFLKHVADEYKLEYVAPNNA